MWLDTHARNRGKSRGCVVNRASTRMICPFLLASGDSGGVVYGRSFAVEVHLFGCMVVGRFAVWPT